MKKNLLSIAVLGALATTAIAQEKPDTLTQSVSKVLSDLELLKKVKISGYLQPQYQAADSSGQLSFAGGNFGPTTCSRFMLRRARVKVEYLTQLTQFVFQVDMSEKGLTIKDCFAKVTEPWLKTISLSAGMMNRPFGFEIGYSSSNRESPERGRMSQIIFPNERDLGAQITIQAPKTSPWNVLKWEAGVFNGTGAPGQGANTSDFDTRKDFITHLSFNKSLKEETIKLGLGASYYNGGFRQGAKKIYMPGPDAGGIPSFVLFSSDTVNYDLFSLREHYGVDAQFSIDWPAGVTTLRGEYIWGRQPGTSATTASPSAQPTTDVYYRNFNGAYFYFLQNIMQTKHQLVIKYDWYDPNTDVAGDQIGQTVNGNNIVKTSKTDIKYTTLGVGWIYHWDANLKLVVYYDKVTNETSQNLSGYWRDIPDNVLTIRMQYKF